MPSVPNDPLRGVRAIQAGGFESVMARTDAFSRAIATQDRINRVFTVSDRVNRAMKSVMPATTMQSLGTTGLREPAAPRAFRVPQLGVTNAFPSLDVAKARQPVRISDALCDTVNAQIRPRPLDAMNCRASRGIAETVRASIKTQTLVGLRDATAFSPASIGRQWAEQRRLTAFAGLGENLRKSYGIAGLGENLRKSYGIAGLGENLRKSYGIAGLGESIRAKQRQTLLDAVRPALRPSWLDGTGIRGLRISAFDHYRESIERFGESMRELALFIELWETKALWFLMSSLGVKTSRALRDLPADEAEEAVFDALEEVVIDGEMTAALTEVVDRHAPHLTYQQRHHLKTFLCLAGESDWLTAVPPMMVGLEGAFHSAAREQKLITAQGTYATRPSKKVGGADAVIKLLPVDEDYEVFLIRRLFGGTGNPHRHGTAADGEREQVLMGIVALAGWIDEFMDLKATTVLAQEMAKHLPEAAERRRLVIAST